NLYVSAAVADATETKAEYIRNRAFDKDHYQKMVIEYLKKFGEANRKNFDKLLIDKLSDALDESQKKKFVTNLLQDMRRDGVIRPVEGKRGRGAKWELSKRPEGGTN